MNSPMTKAIASLFLSFLAINLVWLGLTLFVLPPIAAWLGWSFYQQSARNNAFTHPIGRLVHLLPLLAAIASFVWGMWILNTGYNV